MAILVPGRVCRKLRGREAGAYCLVLTRPEKNKVLVDGSALRRRTVSISELEPTPVVIEDVEAEWETKAVNEALKKEGFS